LVVTLPRRDQRLLELRHLLERHEMILDSDSDQRIAFERAGAMPGSVNFFIWGLRGSTNPSAKPFPRASCYLRESMPATYCDAGRGNLFFPSRYRFCFA
jgi:hypothetical protein